MRATTYDALERGVASTAGIDPTNILAHEKVMLAEYINDATRFCWDYYPWAEFTTTEERYFRDEYNPSTSYSSGAEVYYQDKYWRLWSASATTAPESGAEWYEIGDYYTDPEWTTKGLYQLGARVTYKGKTYLCRAILAGNTASNVDLVNYEWDGITPEDTNYFIEINTQFERYIPYEQTGKNTIGTILSVHTGDPRYNNVQPLDWREGAEGIYVSTLNEDQNTLWIKYRREAPTFTSTSGSEQVPNFLVPAIKAYAYRGWLVGEGQHEKSQLQDIHGLDLLVREVDKLNNQQDRAMPYTISSEPYRRVNARGNTMADITTEQIGGVKEAFGDLTFKFSAKGTGRNATVYGKPAPQSFDFKLESTGDNPVKQSKLNDSNIKLSAELSSVRNVTKNAFANTHIKFTTGKSHRAIPVGSIDAYAMALIFSTISIGALSQYTRTRHRGASCATGITVTPSGKNAIKKASPQFDVNYGLQIYLAHWSSTADWEDLNIPWEDGA
jgi:hypothetical protein